MKSSTYCFHMKTKILADFQIYISVPLRTLDTLFTNLDYLWRIVVLDIFFDKNPLFLSLNCTERSEAAISLKNKSKNHPQPYSC